MARVKTLSGEMVTIASEVKGTIGGWVVVSGTAQAVADYLGENKIDRRYVKHFSLDSSVWYCWFHKG